MRRTTVAMAAVLAGLVAVAAVGVGAWAGTGKPKPRPVVHKKPFHVLVLGDSYSAGNGSNGRPKTGIGYGCYRSTTNYAKLFVQRIDKVDPVKATLTDGACSGAVTADFATAQSSRETILDQNGFGVTVKPQFDDVAKNDDLVFLTIGGNDAGFSSIVQGCLVGKFYNIAQARSTSACETALDNAFSMVQGTTKAQLVASTLGQRFTQVLRGIHQRAPKAKVVLIGYPYLVSQPNFTLTDPYGSSVNVSQQLTKLENAADKAEGAVVAALDAKTKGKPYLFVSMHQTFRGHGLYPGNDQTSTPYAKPGTPLWFVPPVNIAQQASFVHPVQAGWNAEAATLVKDAAKFGVPTR